METAIATLSDLEHATLKERAEVERRGELGLPVSTAALNELEGRLRIRAETKASEIARAAAVRSRVVAACKELVGAGDELDSLVRDHAAGPNAVDTLDLGPVPGHVRHLVGVAASMLTKLSGSDA